MNNRKRRTRVRGRAGITLFAVVAVMLVSMVVRALYSIDCYDVSGGGGTSTGGVYAVSGTIGQPDAGTAMSGGGFSLTGGFWSLVAVVQTIGAPLLSITRSGSSVIVLWPSSPSGFALQQNASLGTPNWTACGLAVTTSGSTNSVTIPSPTGPTFFRLHHP